MATHPNITITSNVVDTNTTTYIRSNVFVYGFAAKGPLNEQITITNLETFIDVYGLPITSAEYSMYESVNNIIKGGGVAICFRIPYVVTNSEVSDTTNIVSYYCNAQSTIPISSIMSDVDDSDYIHSGMQNALGTILYDRSTAYAWTTTEPATYTHALDIRPKTPSRTIFTNIDGTLTVSDDENFTSLGIVPIFIGSLNSLVINTGYAGVATALRNNLTCAINSTLLNANVFTNTILSEYKFLTTANDLYVDALTLLSNNMSANITDNTPAESRCGIVVYEIYVTDSMEISVKALEYFTGTMNRNTSLSVDNLIDTVEANSKYINIELTTYGTVVDFDDAAIRHFVEIPTIESPLLMFGLNANVYDVTDVDAYLVHSDNILGDGSCYDYLTSLSNNAGNFDRIFDYVVMPSVIDVFNLPTDSSSTYVTTSNVQYHSREYYLPHTLDKTNIDTYTYDAFNAKALLTFSLQFSVVDSDATVFFDMPLRATFDLVDIATSNSIGVKLTSDVITLISDYNIFKAKTVLQSTYCNIMLLANHQYVDKFDETDDLMLVPPSAEILYAYCYYDIYRIAAPISYDLSAKFFRSCHGGLILNKYKELFKILFTTYTINSLIPNTNNDIMPNQQALCCGTSTSIYAQHHAFRLRKYLKRHILSIARGVMYEANTEYTRASVTTNISDLLSQYKDNGVITDFKLICDSTNNASSTIDNNELHIECQIKIVSAIVSVLVNITRYGVNIVID